MATLIDLYFTHCNSIMPLLHRPTFMSDIANGLHLSDSQFGGVLLMVCALGSRFSRDRRVFLEADIPSSGGWIYADQVRVIRRAMVNRPTLYELQLYAVRSVSVNPKLSFTIFVAICAIQSINQSWTAQLGRDWHRDAVGRRHRRPS
jgi:hypothetical protein